MQENVRSSLNTTVFGLIMLAASADFADAFQRIPDG